MQLGLCCCCASRRDVKTGRKSGAMKAVSIFSSLLVLNWYRGLSRNKCLETALPLNISYN